MISASQLLYEVIGKPAVAGIREHEPEPCWLCGGDSSRGWLVDEWEGSNFTGQNKVVHPAGQYVCEACVSICARNTPVPGRLPKEGKTFGGNFRNYSHLYDAGEYTNASKGEKNLVRAFLAKSHKGPWFAAIADSGQKHVIPWAPVNPGNRGVVLFEETLVPVPRNHEFALFDHMADLLTHGATKESIERGTYEPGEWSRCEVRIRLFEDRWQYLRGSPWWRLSLWIAQRDEEEVQRRLADEKAEREAKKGKANGKTRRSKGRQPADVDGGGAVGVAPGVPTEPRGKRAQELGHADEPNEDRRPDGNERRAVDHVDAARARNHKRAEREQLSLFR